MKQPLPALVLASLLAASPACMAREVQVLAFRFEIPDGWRTEGGGAEGGDLVAFPPFTGKAYAPPWVTANACLPTHPNCSIEHLPNPTKDLSALGCANAVRQTYTWRGVMIETRWVCDTEQLSDGPVTLGISTFQVGGAILHLGYLSGLGPDDVSRFLGNLARSITAPGLE